MSYAQISETGEVLRYPLSEFTIRQEFPDILFPAIFTPPEFYVFVKPVMPNYDPNTEILTEGLPIFDGTDYIQTWTITAKTYSDEEVTTIFNVEKTSALARINKGYTDSLSSIMKTYPLFERESWPIQVSEAKIILSESTEETPWIDAAALSRGIDKVELANKIIAKDIAFRSLSGNYSGIRQRLEIQIENITEVSLDSITALKAIDWVSE